METQNQVIDLLTINELVTKREVAKNIYRRAISLPDLKFMHYQQRLAEAIAELDAIVIDFEKLAHEVPKPPCPPTGMWADFNFIIYSLQEKPLNVVVKNSKGQVIKAMYRIRNTDVEFLNVVELIDIGGDNVQRDGEIVIDVFTEQGIYSIATELAPGKKP